MIQPHAVKFLSDTAELLTDKWQSGPEQHDEPMLTRAFPYRDWFLREAVAEFGNEIGWSMGATLLHVCFECREPGVLLLAVAALRRCTDDVLVPAIRMLGFRKYNDREMNIALRWIAASTIGLLGARGREARPALLKRLWKERNRLVRPAVLWAFGELGGHSAADHVTLVEALLFERCKCMQGSAELALNAYDFGCADYPWYGWQGRPLYAMYSQGVSEVEQEHRIASCAKLGGRNSAERR